MPFTPMAICWFGAATPSTPDLRDPLTFDASGGVTN